MTYRTSGAKNAHFPHDRNGTVRERIVQLMLSGFTLKAACRAVGIDYATGRRWMQRDNRFMLAVKLSRVARRIRKLVRGNPTMYVLSREGADMRHIIESPDRGQRPGMKTLSSVDRKPSALALEAGSRPRDLRPRPGEG